MPRSLRFSDPPAKGGEVKHRLGRRPGCSSALRAEELAEYAGTPGPTVATRRSGGGTMEAVVDGGGKDEGEDHGTEEAAYHGDGERLEHFGAGAEAEGQREHAGDGGESSHSDGAEAAAAGLNHGFLRREAEGAEALIGVE